MDVFRPPRGPRTGVDRVYLVRIDRTGECRELFVLGGRYGSAGGYRLTPDGWSSDDLPLAWFGGHADQLDPVDPAWARRAALSLGATDEMFDRLPGPGGSLRSWW